ncbi:MAG TPA: flavin reductase family protein [Candidatus Corynebacterium gallistercoris]|uniref:Flavin reductase family protein n=1 Tax=Candidatus Corynebacterium gallistercoris TaxID=2838530 RepID=A0A9D1RYT1_9CORY|nr:flavin reductase family protein [Candidatus Corynebacterium gallistercoris]
MSEEADKLCDPEAAFRDVFRGHPAGIALITATVDGEPVGLTASSVSSLSLDPLSISFSLMKRDGSAGQLLRADSMLVHFLTDSQAEVAASFSKSRNDRPAGEKFYPDQGWTTAETGEPLLPGSRAVLRVVPLDVAQAGQATLIAAEVTDVLTTSDEPALLFQGHKFFSIAGLEPLA